NIKGIQPIGTGISFEWLSGGQNAVFAVMTTSRQPIDTRTIWLHAFLKGWQKNDPYLVMYDFSDPRFYLTSYIRSRMLNVFENHAQVKGREAAVVSHGFLADIVRTFMRRDLRGISDTVERSIFYDR